MGLFDKLKKQNDDYGDFAGDNEYYGEGGYDEADAAQAEEAAPAPAPVEPAAFGATAALKIVNPKSYKDAADIADFLMNGNTVLLNIEGLAAEQAIRLLDYLAGATHAVGGLITRVGRSTIVVAPKNVDVSSIEAMVNN